MAPLRKAFEENIMANYKGKAKILVSALKESETAVLGASALGWDATPQVI